MCAEGERHAKGHGAILRERLYHCTWMKLEEVCIGCVAKQISETKRSEVFHKSCLRVLIKMASRKILSSPSFSNIPKLQLHIEQLSLLLLLLLSHFSRIRLCVTPETAAHQAPPSLGSSRQEHWSGLPFPSPMHESEKSKWSRSVVSDS